LTGLIASYRGRIANTGGDSVLAELGAPLTPFNAPSMRRRPLPPQNAGLSPYRHMNFRIGIHVGDVMVKGGDLFPYESSVASSKANVEHAVVPES
jgi:adenylate cyclase